MPSNAISYKVVVNKQYSRIYDIVVKETIYKNFSNLNWKEIVSIILSILEEAFGIKKIKQVELYTKSIVPVMLRKSTLILCIDFVVPKALPISMFWFPKTIT